MSTERTITIQRDENGNIISLKTNKGKSYDLETAKELIDQGTIKSTVEVIESLNKNDDTQL